MTSPSWQEMTRAFGRIGLLSFGGPAAQIALMHRELVEARSWLTEETYLRALGLCMLLPGPEAMQLATYAGWRLRGIPGGILAGALFVLPGACIIAALVALYLAFGQMPLIQSAFLGVKAAVIAIVFQALTRLARKSLKTASAWIIACLAFAAIFTLDLPFPLIVALAALWGYAKSTEEAEPPPPPTKATPVSTALVWLGLWLAPLALLSAMDLDFLAEIGWFFARLAVVTFGGAYAVLGYMAQTVVQDHGWISATQMIDALGLAETTPGPLILVTQFVAMLSGYAVAGPTLALAAGLVALWATFIPCFLWIFLAGPYLDHIAARPRLSSALGAITAAVVGVILNLALWFALHVLFAEVGRHSYGPLTLSIPDPMSLSSVALILTALAFWLAIVRKNSIPRLLAWLALAGVATLAV